MSSRQPSLAALPAALALLAAPASAGPTIAELVEVADISSLSVSPSGKEVVFRVERPSIERNRYQLDWYVADLESGATRRIGEGGEAIEGSLEPLAVEQPVWSADGRFVFHRALIEDAVGIWRTAVDGSGSRAVVVADADIEEMEGTADGKTVTYALGPTREEIRRAERREYDNGVLIDGSVDLDQNLHHGGWVGGRLATQRLTGRWVSSAGLLWQAPRTRYRLDLETLTTQVIGRVEPEMKDPLVPVADSVLSLRQTGRPTVWVRRTDGRPRIELDRGGRTVTCNEAPCRNGAIAALAWRPGTDDLVFTVQDRHFRQALFRWNTRTGQVDAIASTGGLVSGSRSETRPCAITHTKAVCVAASAVAPPQIVAIDLESGQEQSLFDPNERIRGRVTPGVEYFSWRLPDGREATGTILVPQRIETPAPLFISYYFCPGYLRGGLGDEYPLAPLADAGFVVACLNMVPGPTADIVGDYRRAQASVEALIAVLAGKGQIDPRRVGMGGFSAGSEATMWIATNSDMLAAAAVSSPQYNPSSYWSSARPGRDYASVLQAFVGLGSPDDTPERWQLVSPALAVDRINAPVLMQMPENEARIQIELFTRLRRAAKPAEMFAFSDESHIKFQPRHRNAVYNRYLDWFRYWLQGYTDPDPGKAAQYERWDRLRAEQGSSQVSKDRSQTSAEAISRRRM